jgi:hypothetical protein
VRTQCHLIAQLLDRFASVPTSKYAFVTVVSTCTLLNDVLIAALSGAGQAAAAVLATVSALVGVPAALHSDPAVVLNIIDKHTLFVASQEAGLR